MAVNKVVYDGNTLVDLTGDTVTPETLAEGVTAHDASGAQICGTITVVNNIEPSETDIPKVFFGASLPANKTDRIMPFRYISKTQDIDIFCRTKAQGSSSMNYPKKNQTVKLYSDSECVEKVVLPFKNWNEQTKFCFKANWIDLTHARNIVSARLWGDVVQSRTNYDDIPAELRTSPNQGAIDGFPVKVYAAGIYQGRYTINIPKDAWMANMDDSSELHCILCGESNSDDRSLFRAEANIDGSDWTDEIHDSVPDSIRSRWNEIIGFISSSDDDAFTAGLSEYFYVDSLIDYYLFGLISCGLDAFGKNQLYMTYDGQRWLATMYDMDSTWGLWWDGTKFVEYDYADTEYQDFAEGNGNLLYIRLKENFKEEIENRWNELKNTVLSVANIINEFERFTDIAPQSLVEEDFAETTGQGLFTGIPSSASNNIQQIRDFIVKRWNYCEEYICDMNIPTSYSELAYIESSGEQYIDTGINGGSNASYEIEVSNVDGGSPAWSHLFSGAYSANESARLLCGPNSQLIGAYESTAYYYYLFGNTDLNVHIIKYTSNAEMFLDGSAMSLGAPNDAYVGVGWGDSNWHVFSTAAGTYRSSFRLYSLKMYTDGEMVRNFLPMMRNTDGEIGLYDKVSETFFTNQGDGKFVGG